MRILLKLLAALICWPIGSAIGLILPMIVLVWPSSHGFTLSPASTFFLPFIACTFPLWLLIFVPLFLGVKDTSRLWHPVISALLGASIGFLGTLVLVAGHLPPFFTPNPEVLIVPATSAFTYGAIFALGGIFKNGFALLPAPIPRKSKPPETFGDY